MMKKHRGNLGKILEEKLPALLALFNEKPTVLGVWLFGSQAEGTAGSQSDIDFGVLFSHGVTPDAQLGLEAAMSEIIGTDNFDVVDVRHVNLLLRQRVIAGKLLYERDAINVSDFIERTMIEYPDYAYQLEQFNKDYFAGMRQDYARFRQKAHRRTSQDHRKQHPAT